ncbi:MAG: Abi-alpha family protein [Cyclobacteriaceae bacterium]
MSDDKEINIKSSTIEKGLELAKEFLGKLIGPTVEEIGLLAGDSIKYLRFRNQIRILLKAKEYVEKRKLSVKEIPVKILVPLLENSSLEENDDLQDKWARMLTNMVDSESNLQNQIFPYLLGQISLQEFNQLKELSTDEKEFFKEKQELQEKRKSDPLLYDHENRKLTDKVFKIEQGGFGVNLEEFERANLIRLGLIRELPPKIYVQEFQTGGQHGDEQWHQIEAQYDHNDIGYRITELGERFLEICELKDKNQ